MKVIIAGGRDFGNRTLPDGSIDWEWRDKCAERVHIAMTQVAANRTGPKWLNLVVLCGGAKGADMLGEAWAERWAAVTHYPARWNTEGKAAGIKRNERMAYDADMLVAFWDGESRGTKHMIEYSLKQGLEVHVYRYNSDERF
jgi:hypothetical protein